MTALSSALGATLLIRAGRSSLPTTTAVSSWYYYGHVVPRRFKSTDPAATPESETRQHLVTREEIDQANNLHSGRIQIKDTRHGWGLFVLRDFDKGQLVMKGRALEFSDQRNSHSVQTGWLQHVIMDLPAILVNHSCDPNVGIHDNQEGAFDFIALRNIEKGEELYWDYEAAEYEIGDMDECHCHSFKCRGQLRGYKHHGHLVRKETGEEYIASYLKEKQ